jgi:NTP pyrophosphatase (non-canonical NTP hydrolase)
MLKRTMRNRVLHTADVTQLEVKEAIDALLVGAKPADLPTRLCKSVISTMTQMRKDAILQRKDSLAAKMEVILGELQRGPQKYIPDTAEHPQAIRNRTLRPVTDIGRLSATAKQLVKGARMDSVDIPTRQATEPVMKTSRVRQVARTNYAKSHDLDNGIDQIIEYEIDSRRLAPRLLKVQDLENKLDDARVRYEQCRERARARRLQFQAIKQDSEEKMEDKLRDEMLDYGSHVPLSLPLEFSKFSGKLLDVRERERKSAWFRRYDDASALRGEALRKEKDELDVCSDRFARSFKLQRSHLLYQQDQKRSGFATHWQRKTEDTERICTKELSELKQAVTHWERDVSEAKREAGTELGRIKNNERLTSLPVPGRPAATHRRF